jgi:CIC family chloride channel protein
MGRSRRIYQFLDPKQVAIVEACVIGVVSGLAAVALKQGVEFMTAWRLNTAVPLWLLLPGLGLLGGVCSGWIVESTPELAGSGIPQVKAALSYVKVPLNLRIVILKLVSTMLSLGSGLSLGRQGPTVQIGAALAAQLSLWVPTSPQYRRQLIAAGAAAGLAAGFNAPISGVLFVVEELLQDFSGLTLGTAILASFVGAVVSRLLGGQGLNLNNVGLLQTGFSIQDLPFLILLGVLSGLLGRLFSQGIMASLAFYHRLQALRFPMRVGLAGVVTGLAGAAVTVAAQDNTGLWEFLVTGDASWSVIAIAFVTKFSLTLVAYGSGAPGGIFAPALVLGSALGCLVSFLAQTVHGWLDISTATLTSGNTTTYALTGMGAFFSAATRVPITAIVIVFEMTANFNLVLPLMIGSGIAHVITDRSSSSSLYKALLARQGIHLNPDPLDHNPWEHLTAEDLMQPRVETLPAQMTAKEALKAFSRSHHRGFPVLDQGKLVGIVTQTDLSDGATSRSDGKTLADFMTPHPITVSPEDPLSQVLHLLNRLKVSRLPVTEGNKLVGIITRGDIIRAESDQVSGKDSEIGPGAISSYGAYRTRAPALGQGRLLVPLVDGECAELLLDFAIALAQHKNYELECIHIIAVARNVPPSEAIVNLGPGKQLLALAEARCQQASMLLHTQIRISHDVGRTLLQVIKTRHIDMVLLGWRRQPKTANPIFGSVVDTVLLQAHCPIIVVHPGRHSRRNRWLIPIRGGPNVQLALKLLPALLKTTAQPSVGLCYVATTAEQQRQDHGHLLATAKVLETQLHLPVRTRILHSANVVEAVAHLGQQEHSDVIVLGVSREGRVNHVLNGNIPLEIAQLSEATLILVQQSELETPTVSPE